MNESDVFLDELFRQCEEQNTELKKAVAEYGVDWLISHYQCALMNWNIVINERDLAEKRVKELEAKLKESE